MRGIRLRRGALAVVMAVAATLVVSAPASARGGLGYTWYCGAYQTWTDSYSNDVVHIQSCIRIDGNGGVMAGGHTYVTNYNSFKPINPWHVIVQLWDKNGVEKDMNSCDNSSAPIGSSNATNCTTYAYNIIHSGSKAKVNVCLFYTSGQTNCSPWVAYTKA